MQIEPTTHEHRSSAKVYTYRADYQIAGDAIRWEADITHADEPPRRHSGAIALTSPGVAAVAEEAVRDAVVRSIDTIGGDVPSV